MLSPGRVPVRCAAIGFTVMLLVVKDQGLLNESNYC
jgi:hypothetical protein